MSAPPAIHHHDLLTRMAVIEARLTALSDATKEAFISRDLAVREARAVLEARLLTMNEIREQLGVQKSEFVSREEFAQMRDAFPTFVRRPEHEQLAAQINTLMLTQEKNTSIFTSKDDLKSIIGRIDRLDNGQARAAGRFSLAAVLVALVVVFINIGFELWMHK